MLINFLQNVRQMFYNNGSHWYYWDTGQFYVLLINCISCCPVLAIYFCGRVSVKRVTIEEHKGQSLPFSISYFMCSAILSLNLKQVEEE